MAAIETGKLHIKNGDTVYVISGKEKGKTGKVIKILRDENKAIVERLNMIKRHARPSQKNPSGGIIEKEAGIHISNLMPYCPKCKRPSRVGRKKLAGGEKVRYCKRCNEEIKG
jgi:large subunit ribosomal protein L24